MKIKKSTGVTVFFLLLIFSVTAQKPSAFYPFKGFHVGLTGQAEYITKCSFVYLQGTDPAPKARWTTGWETGIEFSYHLAKYFGVALGINLGTSFSFIADPYLKERRHKIIEILDSW